MQITSLIQQFEAISLDKMNDVALLNRFDSKYQLPVSKLYQVLKAIKEDYFVLEIAGETGSQIQYNLLRYRHR